MALLVAFGSLVWWIKFRRLRVSAATIGKSRVCGSCKQMLKASEFESKHSVCCASCSSKAEQEEEEEEEESSKKEETEEEINARKLRRAQKRIEAKRKRDEINALEKARKKAMEKQIDELTAQVERLREDLMAANEDRAMWKDLQKETKDKLSRHLAERNASERDAASWRAHCEEVKRREAIAKEHVESVSKDLAVVKKKKQRKVFKKMFFSSFFSPAKISLF